MSETPIFVMPDDRELADCLKDLRIDIPLNLARDFLWHFAPTGTPRYPAQTNERASDSLKLGGHVYMGVRITHINGTAVDDPDLPKAALRWDFQQPIGPLPAAGLAEKIDEALK